MYTGNFNFIIPHVLAVVEVLVEIFLEPSHCRAVHTVLNKSGIRFVGPYACSGFVKVSPKVDACNVF